jgi:LysR family transcriptional regulator for bpeEF and oprC
MAAVRAGLGISQAARFAVAPDLASGELVQVLADWTHPPIPIYVVYPPNRHLSARVRAFVEWTAELFARVLADAGGEKVVRMPAPLKAA